MASGVRAFDTLLSPSATAMDDVHPITSAAQKLIFRFCEGEMSPFLNVSLIKNYRSPAEWKTSLSTFCFIFEKFYSLLCVCHGVVMDFIRDFIRDFFGIFSKNV